MTVDTASSSLDAAGLSPSTPRRDVSKYLYFMLAALNTFTLLGVAWVSLRTHARLQQTVTQSQDWGQQLVSLSELETIAVRACEPVVDSLESGEPDRAAATLDDAADAYGRMSHAMRTRLTGAAAGDETVVIARHLERAEEFARTMRRAGHSVLSRVHPSNIQEAVTPVVEMNHALSGVRGALRDARSGVLAASRRSLESGLSHAARMRQLEIGIGTGAFIVSLAGALAGLSVSRAMRRHAIEREHQLAELHAARAVLKDHEEELMATVKQLEVAREAAEDASKAKSSFLANMSHEIRTPMNAVIGFADMLEDPELPASQRDKCLQTIKKNGAHLIAIISDILDISKIESGRLEVERIDCEPSQLMDDALAIVSMNAAKKGLQLDRRSQGPLPPTVKTDPTRLRQILVNLLGNAVKFTQTGGVTICARWEARSESGSVLIFDVIDTGIGMTPEQAARLFKPFSQADSTTTRKYGGTGLGLVICKRLAELLGGDCTLASQPGAGSTFTVIIDAGVTPTQELVTAWRARTQAPPTDMVMDERPVDAIPAVREAA